MPSSGKGWLCATSQQCYHFVFLPHSFPTKVDEIVHQADLVVVVQKEKNAVYVLRDGL
jgi:hypothetical protein